jgi:hypothetical protein
VQGNRRPGASGEDIGNAPHLVNGNHGIAGRDKDVHEKEPSTSIR